MPRSVIRARIGWLRSRAASARRPLAWAVGLGALSGLLLVPEAWLLARVIDSTVIKHLSLEAARPQLLALPALFLTRAILSYFAATAATAASARVKADLRQAMYDKIAALGWGYINGQRTGDLVNLLVEGVDALDKYYAAYLPQMALIAFIPVAILAFIVPADWISAIILILAAPLIPIFMILIGRGTEALNQTQWRKLALMSAHFFDVIEGLSTLKLFGASRYQAEMIGRISDDYRKSTMSVLRTAFLSSLVLEFVATLGIAMIAVFIGFRLYYGEIHFLPGFFVLLLAPEFFRPLRSMGTQYHARMEAIGAAERIVALMETPLPAARKGRERVRGSIGTVRFENVHFSYRPGQPALRGIDITLSRGQRVALIGPSGSGKSTVARLLLGLATPDKGRVAVDGTDLRDIAPEAWLARIGWMPQRPTLFAGTITENIRLGWPDAPQTAVLRAARAASADFIERLPQGFDTVIGEHGQGLSGGEVRRVALARALLRPSEIIILDEAEASLDHETAALIRDGIDSLSREKIVLFIAHRLESVATADSILVLREGCIVEAGSHKDLLRRGGDYATMSGLYHEAAS
jgi:ATP-binding cassette, subfamily C, bacterial CydD